MITVTQLPSIQERTFEKLNYQQKQRQHNDIKKGKILTGHPLIFCKPKKKNTYRCQSTTPDRQRRKKGKRTPTTNDNGRSRKRATVSAVMIFFNRLRCRHDTTGAWPSVLASWPSLRISQRTITTKTTPSVRRTGIEHPGHVYSLGIEYYR